MAEVLRAPNSKSEEANYPRFERSTAYNEVRLLFRELPLSRVFTAPCSFRKARTVPSSRLLRNGLANTSAIEDIAIEATVLSRRRAKRPGSLVTAVPQGEVGASPCHAILSSVLHRVGTSRYTQARLSRGLHSYRKGFHACRVFCALFMRHVRIKLEQCVIHEPRDVS